MNNDFYIREVTLVLCMGADLGNVLEEAIKFSKKYSRDHPFFETEVDDVLVTFTYNGFRFQVRSDSDPKVIHNEYYRVTNQPLGDDVIIGPYPAAVLAEA